MPACCFVCGVKKEQLCRLDKIDDHGLPPNLTMLYIDNNSFSRTIPTSLSPSQATLSSAHHPDGARRANKLVDVGPGDESDARELSASFSKLASLN
jgi:hypothetical protein